MAGILLAQQFQTLPDWPYLIGGVCLGLVLLRLPRPQPSVFVLGLFWAMVWGSWGLGQILPASLEQKELLLEGLVDSVPETIDEGLRFRFRPDTQTLKPNQPFPKLLRLTWYRHAEPLKAGERWRLLVRLKRPHGYFNPGGLDYELWLFSQGIGATGYVVEHGGNQKIADAPPWSVVAWRQNISDRLTQALADRPMRGVIAALSLGLEADINNAQWEVLRRTGTAHLVAISGSHISLIAGLVFLLVRKACARLQVMRWPPHSIAALAAMLAALVYTALADFGIPSQRALIMVWVVMLGILANRNVLDFHVLRLALVIVTLYDPLAVLAPGFWLSFGAVLVILLIVSGRLRQDSWLKALWRINWATSLGLAPLLLLFFQQVSVVSPLANLLAVPAIGVVLTPLCLLGCLLLFLYPNLGIALLQGIDQVLQWIWLALQGLSDLSWAQWQHAAPPSWTLPFTLLGMVLLLAPRGIPGRWLGLVLLLPAISYQGEKPASGYYRFTLLDVGQGLASVVETQNHLLVFDTGPRFGPNFDTGAAVVEPFLRNLGISKIDRLVVSHGDNDHIGGAASLLKHFTVTETLTSAPQQLAQTSPVLCKAGESWEWDGVKFAMLGPLQNLPNENNNSCVLKVEGQGGTMLLTGDIEQEAEQSLVDFYGLGLRADILIAPHHGSKTSSSPPFLSAVAPRWVLIPVGYLNRFGFPNRQVLNLYRDHQIKTLDTAQGGAITVDSARMLPQSFRQLQGRYWNARAELP